MTPRSCDSACSRVGRPATLSRSLAESTAPPRLIRVAISFSLPFANSFTTRAAAPVSFFEKASTSGPFNLGPIDSKAVPEIALRASVFFTTRMYTPCARALLRSSVICETVKPRYSAAMTDCALAATALTSATSDCLSTSLSGITHLLACRAHFQWSNPSQRLLPLTTVCPTPEAILDCVERSHHLRWRSLRARWLAGGLRCRPLHAEAASNSNRLRAIRRDCHDQSSRPVPSSRTA